jgi:hypothetical protein
MAYFAVIEEGAVINTIVADSVKIAEEVTKKVCIEFQLEAGGPGIGWNYNGIEFTAPTNESIQKALGAQTQTQQNQADITPILGAITK